MARRLFSQSSLIQVFNQFFMILVMKNANFRCVIELPSAQVNFKHLKSNEWDMFSHFNHFSPNCAIIFKLKKN